MDTKIKQFASKFFSFDSLPTTLLTILFVLIPVFFIPSLFVSTLFSKILLVTIGTLLALISFVAVYVKRGILPIPRSPISISLILLAAAYLLTSLFSSSVHVSLWGYGFEPATFVGILIAVVLTFLVSVSFTDSKKIFSAYTLFLGVSLLLVIFQTVFILFGSNVLSFLSNWQLTSFMLNTIGKTSELPIFFGLSAILSLIVLELVRLNKAFRIIAYVILVLSLFVSAIVSLQTVWYVLSVVFWALFVYQTFFLNSRLSQMSVASTDMENSETKLQSFRRKFSFKTLLVAVIALFFALPWGLQVSNWASTKLGVGNFEVRPSWDATYEIFRDTMSTSPFLGAGPGRFFTQWQLFRPDINQTDFWNTNFDSGIGFIPTSFVETGLVGIVAWLLLILSVIYVSIRSLFTRSSDQLANYFVISSATAALFLLTINVVYTVGPVLFALTFFFIGLLVVSAAQVGVGRIALFTSVPRSKMNFVLIGVSTAVILASLWLGFVLIQRSVAAYYFQMGDTAIGGSGDIEKGQEYISKAINLAKNDIYYRALSNINVAKLNLLLSGASGKNDVSDAEKTQFSNFLILATDSAKKAVEFDGVNFENHAMLGRVYSTIIPVQINGAYEGSKAEYLEALKLSPRNPSIYLELARVEINKGDFTAAKESIARALELKWNYIDAIFLQSQIDIASGNIQSAIRSAEQIALISPGDPLVHFRLGILYYESKNYQKAVQTFENSISLVPVYANAKYFLGLSLAKVGRRAEAISQFEDIDSTNPGNVEVGNILQNLRAGKDPFAGSSSDSSPENRDELPVDESTE